MPKPRRDGWTPVRRAVFLDTLAQSLNVAAAARAVGMSASSAYRLRDRADGAEFAEAWDIALQWAYDELHCDFVTRALTPQSRDIVRRGKVVGRVLAHNDKLLLALMRQCERTREKTQKAR